MAHIVTDSRRKLNIAFGVGAGAVALVADLLTKWIAIRTLTPQGVEGHRIGFADYMLPSQEIVTGMMNPDYAGVEVVPGCMNFYLAHNTGAAFSFLSGNPGLLALISVVILCGMIWWASSFNRNYLAPFVGMGLLVGGALGNLADRVRLGYVIDFLDCYWGQSHWPTFNVADICVDIGLGLILILAIFTKQLDPPEPESVESEKSNEV